MPVEFEILKKPFNAYLTACTGANFMYIYNFYGINVL